MPHKLGKNDYIDAGEADYDKLFNSNSDWCPLLDRAPDIGIVSQDSDESRSVDIIYNARRVWDINPFREYTGTDLLIENANDEAEEILSYEQWRLDAARVIAGTYPQTKQNIKAGEWNREETLDSDIEVTVGIVRKLADPPLDDCIKDYHILSILAIEEAFHVLKDILYPEKGQGRAVVISKEQVQKVYWHEQTRCA